MGRQRLAVRAICGLVSVLIFGAPAVEAQRRSKNTVPHQFRVDANGNYKFKNDAGTPMNQDYYTCDGLIVHYIDRAHVGRKEWDNLDRGRFKIALGDIGFALERIPNHPTALLMLGLAARMSGETTMPIPFFEHAIRLYPQYAQTHAVYGKYLIDVGSLERGIAKLEEAIEIDPDLGVAHAWLAVGRTKEGHPDLAAESARKAKELGYAGEITGVRADP